MLISVDKWKDVVKVGLSVTRSNNFKALDSSLLKNADNHYGEHEIEVPGEGECQSGDS